MIYISAVRDIYAFVSRVLEQPSSDTDYVVLSDNPGRVKLDAVKKYAVRVLKQADFLELVGTESGSSEAHAKIPARIGSAVRCLVLYMESFF